MSYPRGLTKGVEPFNPIELSRETEKIVIKGDKRKYNAFRIEQFYGQMATARGVGCNLRCGFCWISPSRDYPESYGKFYSPGEVYEKLIEVSSNKYGRAIMSSGVRISGCEPTLGKEHLLSLIEISKKGKDFRWFLLETNGILLGHDEEYVRALSQFKDYVKVRLSFKAGTAEDFQRKTGANAKYFGLPFKALDNLKKYGLAYQLASMSEDPKIMKPQERIKLLEKIVQHGAENIKLLEEETADPFGITKRRLVESGIIKKVEEVKTRVYEPLNNSLVRALQAKRGKWKGEIKITSDELKELIKNMSTRTRKSGCSSCHRQNPWHGHNTEDDLDNKLE
ncbi:MAG: radical SAM protein [archaeon]